MKQLERLYGSMRLDRRVRIVAADAAGRVKADGLDLTLWARRLESESMRTMNREEWPVPADEIKQTWLVRWRPDLVRANWKVLRMIEQPGSEGDKGYPIRNVQEAGRRKFLKIETAII